MRKRRTYDDQRDHLKNHLVTDDCRRCHDRFTGRNVPFFWRSLLNFPQELTMEPRRYRGRSLSANAFLASIVIGVFLITGNALVAIWQVSGTIWKESGWHTLWKIPLVICSSGEAILYIPCGLWLCWKIIRRSFTRKQIPTWYKDY
jgi:hypothetical protein